MTTRDRDRDRLRRFREAAPPASSSPYEYANAAWLQMILSEAPWLAAELEAAWAREEKNRRALQQIEEALNFYAGDHARTAREYLRRMLEAPDGN